MTRNIRSLTFFVLLAVAVSAFSSMQASSVFAKPTPPTAKQSKKKKKKKKIKKKSFGNAYGKRGPQGPTGPTGLRGPTGKSGPSGAAGKTGSPGETGAAGTAGPSGLSGTSGVDGRPGKSGIIGNATLEWHADLTDPASWLTVNSPVDGRPTYVPGSSGSGPDMFVLDRRARTIVHAAIQLGGYRSTPSDVSCEILTETLDGIPTPLRIGSPQVVTIDTRLRTLDLSGSIELDPSRYLIELSCMADSPASVAIIGANFQSISVPTT